MKYFFGLAIILSFASCNDNSLTNKDAYNSYRNDTSFAAIIERMVSSGNLQKFTGDNDWDYAAILIENHMAAISLAKVELKKGKDLTLKKFSKDLIYDRINHLKQLSIMVANEPIKQHNSADEFQRDILQVRKLRIQVKPSDERDTDRLFVNLIESLQVEAVALAKAEAKYGSHQTLKILSRNIISSLPQEIDWLETWLKNRK